MFGLPRPLRLPLDTRRVVGERVAILVRDPRLERGQAMSPPYQSGVLTNYTRRG